MDCTPTCRLPKHAELILCAATRESLPEFRSVAKRICSNPANITDRFGRHLLHVATSCGKADTLEWLVEECGFDLGLRDVESGWTALHRSLYYGQLGCAVKLLQYGADLHCLDKEELSPLDLVMLDSPSKISSAAQAKAITDYKTSLDDELNLEAGDVIENVRLSDMSVNYWSGTLKGKRGYFPKECAELVRQEYCTELYTWGSNTNFTLGHCDENTRQNPELVEALSSDRTINIKEVVMCKFHSVFLSDDGRVYTCGHGRGGRLGHGDEKTQLAPRHVQALGDEKCIGIAAAQDHTAVVMESGAVFTFGLNDMHQLGLSPSPTLSLVPKLVQVKSWKGKSIVGVAAGRYHTVFYTRTEVFTCGLNIGQLGHLKGEKFQKSPRQVSALFHKDIQIACVECGDAATVCVTLKGDVFLLSQYTCHKVINRFPELTRLLVSDASMDLSSGQDVSKVQEKLTLTLLNAKGLVYQWKAAYGGIRKCHWSLKRELIVTDIAVGKSLFIVTDRGEGFTCTKSDDHIHHVTKGNRSSSPQSALLVGEWDRRDVIGYKVERLPMVHRGVRIFTDVKSRGCAVLQIHPMTGLCERPKVSESRMCKDFKQLLEEATVEDTIHDITLMVDTHTYPAHSFILASRSQEFRDVLSSNSEQHQNHDHSTSRILKLENVKDCKRLTNCLQGLYSGDNVDDSVLFENQSSPNRATIKQVKTKPKPSSHQTNGTFRDEDLDNIDTLLMGFEVLNGRDLDDFSTPALINEEKLLDEKPHGSKQNGRRTNTKKSQTGLKNKRKDITKEEKKKSQGTHHPTKKGMRFTRKSCPNMHDVTIESDDGVLFDCHKCVLVARLDYFRSMLACGWLEASSELTVLKMPLHSSVLSIVLDYLYTDEAYRIQGSKDVEFIGNVLVVADQLLITRLAEICESLISKLISSRNVMELIEFSCVYNAHQLKTACLEYICFNLNSLLEAGYLGLLKEETLEEVSKAYKKAIPNMAWRIITPQEDHLAAVAIDAHPSPSKKRRSSSRKKHSRSESEGEGVVTKHEGQVTKQDGQALLNGGSSVEVLAQELSDAELEDIFERPNGGEASAEGQQRIHLQSVTKEPGKEREDESRSHETELKPRPTTCAVDEGLWYRKQSEENAVRPDIKSEASSKNRRLDTITSSKKVNVRERPQSKAESTPGKRQINTKKQESHQHAWGTVPNTLSSVSADLRAIMEQELKHDTRRPPHSHNFQSTAANNKATESPSYGGLPVKWGTGGRQSQKQRRRTRSSTSEEITTVKGSPSAKPTSPEPKPNPWNLASKKPTAVRSLRELIEQEKQSQLTTQPAVLTKPLQASLAKNKESNNRKGPSWSLLPNRIDTEKRADKNDEETEVMPKSVWGSPPSSNAPSSASVFADILHSQECENTNLDRARKKPLSQIQLEDCAIQELLEHYGGRCNPCEYIMVERIPACTATPVWNRDRRTSASANS